MMLTKKRVIGDLGEEIALNFLRKKGFQLIERNYLKKFGEIDLIFKKRKKIYFIEVKTGELSNDFYNPKDNLNKKKLINFERIGKMYLKEKKLENFQNSFGIEEKIQYYFWAVIIYLDREKKKARVELVKDLFLE